MFVYMQPPLFIYVFCCIVTVNKSYRALLVKRNYLFVSKQANVHILAFYTLLFMGFLWNSGHQAVNILNAFSITLLVSESMYTKVNCYFDNTPENDPTINIFKGNLLLPTSKQVCAGQDYLKYKYLMVVADGRCN